MVVAKALHGLLPRFLGTLRGFGYNKTSWIQELHLAGFSFLVLPNAFLTHIFHKEGGHGRMATVEIQAEVIRFRKELARRYEASEAYTGGDRAAP